MTRPVQRNTERRRLTGTERLGIACLAVAALNCVVLSAWFWAWAVWGWHAPVHDSEAATLGMLAHVLLLGPLGACLALEGAYV